MSALVDDAVFICNDSLMDNNSDSIANKKYIHRLLLSELSQRLEHSLMKTLKKYVFDPCLAILLYGLMLIFKCLPLDYASALGGLMGRQIGFRLGITRRAIQNLRRAFPGTDEQQIERMALDMWDNLGRVIGEYPHLKSIARSRVLLKNGHLIEQIIKDGRGGIFISGHMANWETHVPLLLETFNQTAVLTYRALNNPFADSILRHYRTLGGAIPAFPKTRESGRQLMKTLKSKGFLAILIDQKYNEGMSIPFLGIPAMTNPVAVQLAQKYGCPIIPAQCRRLRGAHFEITIHEPVYVTLDEPMEDTMIYLNDLLSDWVRQEPAQWLWLHRRWDSAGVRAISHPQASS